MKVFDIGKIFLLGISLVFKLQLTIKYSAINLRINEIILKLIFEFTKIKNLKEKMKTLSYGFIKANILKS